MNKNSSFALAFMGLVGLVSLVTGCGQEPIRKHLALEEEGTALPVAQMSDSQGGEAEASADEDHDTSAPAEEEIAVSDGMHEKTKNYEAMIAEQFKKGDNYARKNAAMLANNTKQYAWPRGRSRTSLHDRYIVSRAYHDHMKFYIKGYAPNRRNYMGYR